MNPGDAEAMGVGDGDFVARQLAARARSRLRVRLSHRDTPGTCFIPFHFREAAANLLTIDEIDPMGKIPEFKFCAVRIERAGGAALHEPVSAREGCLMATARHARPAASTRGPRRRAGKFPGPSLIPALNAIQARLRLAAARGARRAGARRAPAAVRDRGADLVLPPLPHDAAEGRPARGLPRPRLLAARLRRADRRDCKARYGDDVEVEIVEVSCLGRCDIAPAAAVDERPIALADADELVDGARRASTARRAALERSGEPAAERPLRRGEERYRRAPRAPWPASSAPTRSSRR